MSSITGNPRVPSGGYPNNTDTTVYRPPNVAQPAIVQEFKNKLDSLNSHGFNQNGKETNNNFLVNELYDIYANHRDSNNNHLNEELLEELSTLIDKWIATKNIQEKRIANGNRIIELLNIKYTAVQDNKKNFDKAKNNAVKNNAVKKNVSKPAPTKPAPTKPTPTKPTKQKPRTANELLNELHTLLSNIYQSEYPNVGEDWNRDSLSEDDCTKLTEKRGELLPKDVLDKILAYCCSKNDDLNRVPLNSVLQNLHTKFKDISADTNLSLYEIELIRIMVGIREFTEKNTAAIRELDDALAKFKIILGDTIDQDKLTELAKSGSVKFFETPTITLPVARERWEKLQRDIIAADIKLDDNNKLELPDNWRDSIATITKHVSELPPDQQERLSILSDDSLCDIVDFCLVEQSDIRQNNLTALLTILHNIFGTITIERNDPSLYEQGLIQAMKKIKQFPKMEKIKQSHKENTIQIIELVAAIHKFRGILGDTINQERLIKLGNGIGNLPRDNTIYLILQKKYASKQKSESTETEANPPNVKLPPQQAR